MKFLKNNFYTNLIIAQQLEECLKLFIACKQMFWTEVLTGYALRKKERLNCTYLLILYINEKDAKHKTVCSIEMFNKSITPILTF